MTPRTRRRSLTGVKPTGIPHLGNYVGAIRPALELATTYDAYYFVADYHALTTVRDAEQLASWSRSVTAIWMAAGRDQAGITFYRQSDVPETFELAWVLSCLAAKGLMNRAHAYKAARDANEAQGGADLDAGVSMGLFNYPILMAADILIVGSDVVPVGRDQVQHVEYTRDLAQRFNHLYGDTYSLVVPEGVISEAETSHTVPGLDGRKMSKSYDNTIPIVASRAELTTLLKKVKTDSVPLEAPKDPDTSALVDLYRLVSTPDQVSDLEQRLRAGGLGWGHVKAELTEQLDAAMAPLRDEYERLMAHPDEMEDRLAAGAQVVRTTAGEILDGVRAATGIAPPRG